MSARRIHSFLGLFFSVALVFLALTGSLSVFADELDWLTTPAMRVEAGNAGKGPLGRSFDAATAAMPEARPDVLIRFPGARYADRLRLVKPDRSAVFVWVDPYSGSVTGTGAAVTVRQVLRELHRSLSTERTIVMIAISAMSLPLAATVIAGVLLYRRFWSGFFRWPRFSGSRRAMLSDLHRLTAVWSLPFLIITIATSAVFLSEMVGFGPPMTMAPEVEAQGPAALPDGFDGKSLDRIVERTSSALPGLIISEVTFPAAPGKPVAVRGADGTALVRPTASVGYSEAGSMSLLMTHPAAALGGRMRLFEAVRVLHYGTALGLPTRLLWLAFGLGLAALGILGAMICSERLTKEFKVRGRAARSGWGHYLTGSGIGNWIGLAAAVLALVLAAGKL
ncbi:MAG TPA: PepSY-associated TM helix domain-containing protein [Albidovulum sp.]|uniref:PepSY-associated TM helix domain-containing protein n=1 Tax=Albidovulum sp. TaxID=1872424 RepID=UPI002D13254C|nr:PepSY-associated TM helix domain-containing protein [Albidovulum sp.]